ncbi:polysaccharide pyruvyl transferase family protein [Candidatus Gracilibacteria bacterium]|nr:polysaccharide pyruvyl transferase family protein [Candidatus Gracilibacteria bacterium]
MKKSPKKILIMALVGKQNIGDEYILKSEYTYLKEKYPDTKFTIVTFDITSTPIVDKKNVSYISYFPNNLKKHPLKNIYFFLKQSFEIMRNDLIVVGGGGIFFDNEPNINFKKLIRQWKLRLSLARFFRKKICFFGISLEIKSSTHLRQLRQIISKKDLVLVRNQKSKEMLLEIGVNSKKIDDVVFLNRQTSTKKCRTSTQENNKKIIGFSLRGGFFSLENIQELKRSIKILKEKNYEIIFLSHSLVGDKNTNDISFVEDIFGKEKYIITKSLEETEKMYEKIDIMVSMRFHSTILSAMGKIPCVILSYGPKTDALISDFDANNISLQVKNFSSEDFLSKIYYVFDNYQKEQEKISKIYQEKHIKLLQKLEKIDIMGES